ncbi:MAG TPA: ABC transporter permease [Candidatus Gracilibacteria bacterium]|nr:ABC transporter permease [Candidatus Gracilibacteria bacterium]
MSYNTLKREHLAHSIRIIKELVISDFKLRYQGSYLGYFWTLIKPLLLFGVIYTVFTFFMPVAVENYAIYLLLGVLIWNFFSESTLIGMNTFLSKRDLVTKIYFSRAALVYASTISSLITLLLNLVIFFFFLAIAGVAPGWEALFFILYLAEMYLIATGITFVLASLTIHFRDLQHIWEILLQIGFWLTPIIYPITVVPFEYHSLIFLNPWARIIEYSRDIFIRHHIPSLYLNIILFIGTVIIFALGYAIFKTQENKIAEKL